MFRNLASTSLRTQTRQFSLSTARRAGSDGSVKADKHAVNKAQAGETHNVQEANASAGMQKKSSGSGGNATDQKDTAGGKAKAKKEFPEAPDVAIGMQDERGGKGG